MNKTYRPADGDESGWGSDEWDSSDDDNQSVPPPLPPKDVGSGASHIYMNTDNKGRKPPRILPIVKDGKKSQYYYFVVPERDKESDRPPVCSPITAEIKPFAVGGVQVDSSVHRRQQEGRYQNINFHNKHQSPSQSYGGGTHQAASPVVQSDNGNVGAGAVATDPSLISWTGLTGMTPVGTAPAGEPLYGNTNNNPDNVMSQSTPAVSSQSPVSMMSVRQKIIEVQRQVHGVTQDECNAALSSNRWDVDAAVKYLKVEQLFRLGIAPKERCQNLLESLKWNLQMAGSMLLDEVSTGSAV